MERSAKAQAVREPICCVWVDGSRLGSDFYELLPTWLAMVEETSMPTVTAIAHAYALALANAPGRSISHVRFEVEGGTKWSRQRDRTIARGHLTACNRELTDIELISVAAGRVFLTWPASHSLYALEPLGNA
jgi:hypothetical protein